MAAVQGSAISGQIEILSLKSYIRPEVTGVVYVFLLQGSCRCHTMNTTTTTMLAFFAAFFVLVEGHNWLLSPHSRNGNKDSQSKPCDDYIGEPKVLRVFQGEEMDVSWTTLHTGDPHSLYFVPASQEDNLESSNIGHVGDYPALQGLTNFTVPTVDPGLYILQYRWEIYRNCVDMQVLGNHHCNVN